MSTTTVHFSIEGEFLTDLVRGMVTEGRWRDGLAILLNGLDGMTTDQALSILRGTHKLTGQDVVDLVPDDRAAIVAAHVDLVAWQHAGAWKRPGRGLWRPYAVVTALGSGDVPEEVSSRQRPELWNRLRILHYADDPGRDDYTEEPEVLGGLEMAAVLWRRIEDPPLWLEGSTSSEAALRDFLGSGQGLHERGAWDDGNDGIRRPARQEPEADVRPLLNFDRIYTDLGVEVSAADRIAMTLGLDGKLEEAVQALFGEEDDRPPEPDREFRSDSGYILPDGTFYGCKYMHHPRLAASLLRHVFRVEVDDPQVEADNRNWLRIQASVSGGHAFLSPKNRPTKRQEITLADWCIARGIPYPKELS